MCFAPMNSLSSISSLLRTSHSSRSTPHCRLVAGEICNAFKRWFPRVSLCVSCLFVTCSSQMLSLRRYARTMHEKRFAFLLPRFSLVVQEHDYIRVGGFLSGYLGCTVASVFAVVSHVDISDGTTTVLFRL